ncbi:MAG: homoserine kinase [Chloroflexota bacterium]
MGNNSNKVTAKQVETLHQKYDLSHWHVQPLSGGHANSSFLLDGPDGAFILTVFETAPLPKVVRLGRILQWLAAYNFPTTRIVPTAKGKLVGKKWGKPHLLKHYIAGETDKSLSDSLLYELGCKIGHLHQISPPPFLATRHDYYTLWSTVLNNSINPTFGQWLVAEVEKIADQIPATLPKGLIHGDIFWDNVLVSQGKLQAIIDFERAHYQVKLFDIGMAIVGTCVTQGEVDLAKARALVTGYESQRALQTAEKKWLQRLIRYGALLTAVWRFWKYHLEMPSPDKAQEHEKMVKIADNISSIAAPDFAKAVFAKDIFGKQII